MPDPDSTYPRPYDQWRPGFDRAEDAAYTFGYYLIKHCRTEALEPSASAPLPTTHTEFRAAIEHAVDIALHNVVDMLEGFWPLSSGERHNVYYTLTVNVTDLDRNELERIDIAPAQLDLPIGYWKWKDGEFR